MTIQWTNIHEKSGQAYGSCEQTILVSEATESGYLTLEEFAQIYAPIAKLADKIGTIE